MDIPSLLRTHTYEATVSLDELRRDTNIIHGLTLQASRRAPVHLGVMLLLPIAALGFVAATANHTSQSDMPITLGVPLAIMAALELNSVVRFFRWQRCKFPLERYQLPLAFLRALDLQPNAPVSVKQTFHVNDGIRPIQVTGHLASGVTFDVELSYQQLREEIRAKKMITSFFALSVTLRSAPGTFPRVESLGPAIAQHLSRLSPDFVSNTPGALTVRTKVPYRWAVDGNTSSGPAFIAASMIEAMHAMMFPQRVVADPQRALGALDLSSEVPGESAGAGGSLVGVGAGLLLLTLLAGAAGAYNLHESGGLKTEREALYQQSRPALRQSEVTYDPGPMDQTMAQREARHAAWTEQHDAALFQVESLRARADALGRQMDTYEHSAVRFLVVACLALLPGLTSLIVGLMRLKRRAQRP